MFKNKYNIEEPEYLEKHYWNSGIHLWKKNIKGDEITKKIIKPLKKKTSLYAMEAF